MSLPLDCNSIMERLSPRELSSIFYHSIFINGDARTKHIWLEQETGKNCCMISAREMELTWRDTDPCWRWAAVTGSRFPEVAELMEAYWLDIFAKFDASDLSSNTTYGAYLVFNYSDRKSGLAWPKEGLVRFRDHVSKRTVYLEPSHNDQSRTELRSNPTSAINLRGDGWMEVELGDLSIDACEKCDIFVSLKEIHGLGLKKGLILEGIELRPKKIANLATERSSQSTNKPMDISSGIQSTTSSMLSSRHEIHEDYMNILVRAVHRVEYSTMEELYSRLCNSILIDNGRKIFYLNKRTAKKCYILSARELDIAWGSDDYHWGWTCSPHSRFPDVAELKRIAWLDILGHISISALSAQTTYGAYLIFKFATSREGFSSQLDSSILIAGRELSHAVILDPIMSKELRGSQIRIPVARDGGWMEIQLAESFFVGTGDGGKVRMSLKEPHSFWKKGLIIEGIEIRPINSN